VSKAAESQESRLKRGVKAVPWMVLLQGSVIVGTRWAALTEKERVRLTRLVRQSRGRVSKLSAREKVELRRLARKLDVQGMGRELIPLVRGGKQRKRR
jgi:hypothetical protein